MKKAIKIMAIVLFVAGMTAITSCSKSKEKLIVGKWKLESVSANIGGQTFQMSVAEMAELMSQYGEEMEEVVLEFKNDGKVYTQGEIIGYAIDGDNLTITQDSESFTFKILELTSSNMTLEGTQTEEGETSIFTLYFKKV